MAKKKAHIDPDRAKRRAFVLEEDFEPTDGAMHAHARAQLVHAAEGVITIRTEGGLWVAPPQRAVWIPARAKHAVSSRRPFRLLTLYVTEDAFAEAPPEEPRVVAVDRLVQELLAAAARFGPDYPTGGPEERLVNVILDRLPALALVPLLHLPQPETAALVRITRELVAAPADRRTLDKWAAHVKMTPRTAARRFLAETGLTFGQWRTQLRLHAALEKLAAGASVTAVAFDVGYDDVSSFIAAFKTQMGETPARYFAKG